MKKLIRLSALAILWLISFNQTFAAPRNPEPVPVQVKFSISKDSLASVDGYYYDTEKKDTLYYEIKNENNALVPVIIALIASLTTADAILLGLGAATTTITVTFYLNNPAPETHWEFPSTPNEVVDIPNNPGNRGRQPWRPQMQPEDQFILIVNLANAGYQGYLRLTQGGSGSVQDQLTTMYLTDPNFAAIINQMQRDYDSGKMIKIPVYKPGTGIFEHFNYMFKVDHFPSPAERIYPKPGDPEWATGIRHIKNVFNRFQSTHMPADSSLLRKFIEGDCFGDTECKKLQKEISAFFEEYAEEYGQGGGDWTFDSFEELVQELSKKSTEALIEQLLKEENKIVRDAILTVLFRRGMAGEKIPMKIFREGFVHFFFMETRDGYEIFVITGDLSDEESFILVDDTMTQDYQTVYVASVSFEFYNATEYEVDEANTHISPRQPGRDNSEGIYPDNQTFETQIEYELKKMGYAEREH